MMIIEGEMDLLFFAIRQYVLENISKEDVDRIISKEDNKN